MIQSCPTKIIEDIPLRVATSCFWDTSLSTRTPFRYFATSLKYQNVIPFNAAQAICVKATNLHVLPRFHAKLKHWNSSSTRLSQRIARRATCVICNITAQARASPSRLETVYSVVERAIRGIDVKSRHQIAASVSQHSHASASVKLSGTFGDCLPNQTTNHIHHVVPITEWRSWDWPLQQRQCTSNFISIRLHALQTTIRRRRPTRLWKWFTKHLCRSSTTCPLSHSLDGLWSNELPTAIVFLPTTTTILSAARAICAAQHTISNQQSFPAARPRRRG